MTLNDQDDRALWARLADEATAYLDQGPTLWEDL